MIWFINSSIYQLPTESQVVYCFTGEHRYLKRFHLSLWTFSGKVKRPKFPKAKYQLSKRVTVLFQIQYLVVFYSLYLYLWGADLWAPKPESMFMWSLKGWSGSYTFMMDTPKRMLEFNLVWLSYQPRVSILQCGKSHTLTFPYLTHVIQEYTKAASCQEEGRFGFYSHTFSDRVVKGSDRRPAGNNEQ